MKKAFKNIISLLLILAAFQGTAQEQIKKEKKRYEHFKERNISKTYSASGNTLTIDNRFGDVKIETWEKNEIKVDIHIEASSTDKDYAEKSFERIDVKDSQEGKNIKFKTTLGDRQEKMGCNNCSSTLEIKFEIHIPSGNSLVIENTFGDIILPDYNGTVSLTCKYGSLTTGKLTHPEKIAVDFGNADIKNVGNIDLDFKYSSIKIGSLSGDCKLKMSFCGYSKISLDKTLTSLTLNDSYSTVHLEPADNLPATYVINTSYGSFVDKTGLDIKRVDNPSRYGPDQSRKFEGKAGAGTVKIDVKSSFGKIMIGKGSESDMKEKKKVRT